MKHNDWIVFLRLMSGAGMLTSAFGIVFFTPWAVVGILVTGTYLVASMVADGFIGDWRTNHDRAEYIRKAEENARMGRQLRRMQALFEAEANK